MVAKSTQYAVCLGLAGGFALAIAPAVHAQQAQSSQGGIRVTGGNFSGQGAFFVPTPGGGSAVIPGSGTGTGGSSATVPGGSNTPGKVNLFDVNIQKLRL